MATDQSGISSRDLLVFVPAAASAMALSWEVGSFLPIGGGSFMLFTLTEHFLFAVQALPFTLVAAGLLILPQAVPIEFAAKTLQKIAGPEAPSDADLADGDAILKAREARGFSRLRLGFVAAALVLVFSGLLARSATYMVFGVATVGFAILLSKPLRPAPIFSWLFICSLGLAMAVGFDESRHTLNFHRNLIDVKIRQVATKAVVVRSGERGVLLFEPLTGRFSVERWDAVEGLNWQRVPSSTTFRQTWHDHFSSKTLGEMFHDQFIK